MTIFGEIGIWVCAIWLAHIAASLAKIAEGTP